MVKLPSQTASLWLRHRRACIIMDSAFAQIQRLIRQKSLDWQIILHSSLQTHNAELQILIMQIPNHLSPNQNLTCFTETPVHNLPPYLCPTIWEPMTFCASVTVGAGAGAGAGGGWLVLIGCPGSYWTNICEGCRDELFTNPPYWSMVNGLLFWLLVDTE